jgi:hypothetical protein
MQRSGTSKEFTVKRQGYIHNYVYKLEGLIAKESGRIESEESNRSGGVSARFARHRNRSGKFTFSQGVIRKVALSSSSLGQEPHRGQGLLWRHWRMVALATWRVSSSGERGKTESRPRGSLGHAHLGGEMTASARRRPAMAAGSVRKGRRHSGVEEVTVRG